LPVLLICMKGQQAESTTVEERRFSAAKSASKEPGFSPCGFRPKIFFAETSPHSLQLSSQSPSGPELGKPLHPPHPLRLCPTMPPCPKTPHPAQKVYQTQQN
jgi:hypothetical protein